MWFTALLQGAASTPNIELGIIINSSSAYDIIALLWDNSVVKYSSITRTKILNSTTKSIAAISGTRTKLFSSAKKTINLVGISRTKVVVPTSKSVLLNSKSRTKVFIPSSRTKTFTTTKRG